MNKILNTNLKFHKVESLLLARFIANASTQRTTLAQAIKNFFFQATNLLPKQLDWKTQLSYSA